jgi:dihydrofolate reductase
MVTLDGFFAGPDGDISWHQVDEEFNAFAIDQLQTAGGLLFGRVTYQMMAGYWPTPAALRDDPIVAEKMNSIPKIVFSRTLDQADWPHTQLVKTDAAEEVARLRQQPGKDLFVFGSADLASNLIHAGFIDEYRLMVNPVILGGGMPLFKDIKDRINLRLTNTKVFPNGNVLLYYQPDRGE